MKTVIFLESVADPSILLPGSAEIAGRDLTPFFFKVSGERIALKWWWWEAGADK